MIVVIHGKCLLAWLIFLLVIIAAASRIEGGNPFPLQLVPIQTSCDSTNFTMWTPQNWTHASSTVKISNNLYLLQIQNDSSFHVVVPESNSKRIRTGKKSWPATQMRHSLPSSAAATPKMLSSRIAGRSLQRTSQQSLQHHCTYAMNGGPFQLDGSPVGVVVVENGIIVSPDFGPMVGFGIAKPSQKANTTSSSVWILGRLESEEQIKDLKIQQFVSGFDWLVYNGHNIALYHNNTTGATRAARSAVGVTRDGTLLLVVSDGCEHCFLNQGLTLLELANAMIEIGAAYAINFDGGSSSVLVQKSTPVTHPSCISVPIARWFQCERPVSSIICIR